MNRFLVAVISVLTVTLQVSPSHAQESSQEPKEAQSVRKLIAEVVEAGRASFTFAEQHLARHGIDAAFESMLKRPASEQRQVCGELLLIKNHRDLVLLERAILKKEYHYLDSCRARLVEKIEAVYESGREELRRIHGPIPHPDARLDIPGGRNVAQSTNQSRCEGKIGNYPPLIVDPMGGASYGTYVLDHYNHHISRPKGLGPKEIIFTLDDGPWPGRTEKALATFEEHCVHITYFLVGRMIAAPGGADLMKKEIEAGHNIGNHTWDHPLDLGGNEFWTPDRFAEVTKQQDFVEQMLLKFRKDSPEKASMYMRTPFFRFPGGNESPDVVDYLQKHNMPNFTWHAGANDWLPKMTPELELREALQEIEYNNGGIFIAHDIHQETVDMLPYLLDELTKRGYKIRQMVPGKLSPPDTTGMIASASEGEVKAAATETNFPDPTSDEMRGKVMALDAKSNHHKLFSVAGWKNLKITDFYLNVNVRGEAINDSPFLLPASLMKLASGRNMVISDLASIELTGNEIEVDGKKFAEAKILKLSPGVEAPGVNLIYIWESAIAP